MARTEDSHARRAGVEVDRQTAQWELQEAWVKGLDPQSQEQGRSS